MELARMLQLGCMTWAGLFACGGLPHVPSPAVIEYHGEVMTTLSTLSNTEAQQLCEKTLAAARNAASAQRICTLFALAYGENLDTPAACKKKRTDCLDTWEDPYDAQQCADDRTGIRRTIKDCTATVEAYLNCFNEELRLADGYLSALSCNAPAKVQEQLAQQPPFSCAELRNSCPSVDLGLRIGVHSHETPRPK